MGIGFLDALKDHESWVVVIFRHGERGERVVESSSKAHETATQVQIWSESETVFVEKVVGPDGQEYWNPAIAGKTKTWEELR